MQSKVGARPRQQVGTAPRAVLVPRIIFRWQVAAPGGGLQVIIPYPNLYLNTRTWYPMAETWDPKFHPQPILRFPVSL